MKTCRNFMLLINISEMLHSLIAVFVAPSSFSVDHDMVCWHGDLTFIQYNELHDLIADFQEVCLNVSVSVSVEPTLS